MFGADLDLLVNPKEEDVKFLDNVDRLFEGIGRLINEPALYKIYKNKFYYSFMDAIKVCMLTVNLTNPNRARPDHIRNYRINGCH